MLVRKEGGQWTASISVNRSSSVLIFVNGTSGKNRIIKYYKNSSSRREILNVPSLYIVQYILFASVVKLN